MDREEKIRANFTFGGSAVVPINRVTIHAAINRPTQITVVTPPIRNSGGFDNLILGGADESEMLSWAAEGQRIFFEGMDFSRQYTVSITAGDYSANYRGFISAVQASNSVTEPVITINLEGTLSAFSGVSTAALLGMSQIKNTVDPFKLGEVLLGVYAPPASEMGDYNVPKLCVQILKEIQNKSQRSLDSSTGLDKEAKKQAIESLQRINPFLELLIREAEDATIVRPGITANDITRDGFLSEILPLFSSDDFLSTFLDYITDKFLLQVVELGGGTVVIEKAKSPLNGAITAASGKERLSIRMKDISFSGGAGNAVGLKAVHLVSHKRRAIKNEKDDFVTQQLSVGSPHTVGVYPRSGSGSGRIDYFGNPQFFDYYKSLPSNDEEKQVTSEQKDKHSGEDFAQRPSVSGLSKEAILGNLTALHTALLSYNEKQASVLDTWAKWLYWFRRLAGTSAVVNRPLTPVARLGQIYEVMSPNGNKLFESRLQAITHVIDLSPNQGQSKTTMYFDNVLIST